MKAVPSHAQQGKNLVITVVVSPETFQNGVNGQGEPIMVEEDLTAKVCECYEVATRALRQAVRQDREAAQADNVIAQANAAKGKGRLQVQ